MWSYYGSKSKVVDYYPKPVYRKIIEPFAGSARYSLKYWENDIVLVDKYEVVIRIWKWLQKCSPTDISGLPKLKPGDDLRAFGLSDDERLFLGFVVNRGVSTPKNILTKWASNLYEKDLHRISSNLYKIKHWEIRLGNFWDIPNQEATWFIDPPYQFGGEHYAHNNSSINFYELSVWCKSRQGQSIVCENSKADWMDFRPMKKMKGTLYSTTESIWSNMETIYDNTQIKLIS